MPWDNSKISVGLYWLVHNIDSALESALMALIKMASSKRDSWELLLRKQISAGFTKSAKELAKSLGVILISDIELDKLENYY